MGRSSAGTRADQESQATSRYSTLHQGSCVGLTEGTGFVRTSHSSLTRQEMVADLMSEAQGPHTGLDLGRGEPRRIPGQGSSSLARTGPGAPSPPPISLHRQFQANQCSSLQLLLPDLLLLPISFHAVQFLHILFRNFRAGSQATQERQKK